MTYVNDFDVMVVYSDLVAKSPFDKGYLGDKPFPDTKDYSSYNDTYSYFLLQCRERGLKAAFTTSRNIKGEGFFLGYWTFEQEWKRSKNYALAKKVFLKFNGLSRVHAEHMIKLRGKSVRVLNPKQIIDLFKDKLTTWRRFKEFAIPSVKIKKVSKQGLFEAKQKLDQLLSRQFTRSDLAGYLVKDRFGAEGKRIFKIQFDGELADHVKRIKEQSKHNIEGVMITSYILQPLVACDNGFSIKGLVGHIDFRVIVINRQIVQSYIRISTKNSFRCDGEMDGRLVYIEISDIPPRVRTIAMAIKKYIDSKKCGTRVYTLDFIKSNSGKIYLVEGNDKPGITWTFGMNSPRMKAEDLINNKNNSQCLIRLIVAELKDM